MALLEICSVYEPYVPFLILTLDKNSSRDQFNFHHSA